MVVIVYSYANRKKTQADDGMIGPINFVVMCQIGRPEKKTFRQLSVENAYRSN